MHYKRREPSYAIHKLISGRWRSALSNDEQGEIFDDISALLKQMRDEGSDLRSTPIDEQFYTCNVAAIIREIGRAHV